MNSMLERRERRRKWVLQGVLVGILALMMGGAQWLRMERLGKVWITLGELEQFGEIALRRPLGWSERYEAEGVVLEESPRRHARPRRLGVWWTWAGFISPLEYLVRAGHIPRQVVSAGGMRSLPIAGWPGVMAGKHLTGAEEAKGEGLKEVWGCSVLPTGQAVVMRLTWEGPVGSADEDVLRQVGSSLRIGGQPEMEQVERLDLWGGIRLDIPASLASGPEQPAFHDGRVLIGSSGTGWLGVDLVPLIWNEPEGAQKMAAILIGRDRLWTGLAIQRLDERTWLGRRGDGGAVAYVLSSGGGAGGAAEAAEAGGDVRTGSMGLLAEFRWHGPGEEAMASRVEQLWKEMAASVKFTEADGVAKRVQAGAAAIKALPQDAMEILDGVSSRQEWEWFSENSPQVSREVLRFSGGRGGLGGTRAGVGGLKESWRLSRDWRSYLYRRVESEGRWPVGQESRVSGGNLETVSREGPLVVKSRGQVPANFIPGAALPLVLGRLARESMIFTSESIIGSSGYSPLASLTLIVEPAFDVPRYPASEQEKAQDPLACWRVRVNGSSRSSRWYLTADGHVEAIWFADGVRWHRVEKKAVTEPG